MLVCVPTLTCHASQMFILFAANQLVSDAVKNNPNAQGVVLLTHNETAPEKEGLEPLHGIENGTEELNKVFTTLGLAVVYLAT